MIIDIPKKLTLEDIKISCIYFIVKDGEILYIGQSKNFLVRFMAYKKANYDYIRIIPCKPENLLAYEKRWILRYMPKYNERHLYTSRKFVGKLPIYPDCKKMNHKVNPK